MVYKFSFALLLAFFYFTSFSFYKTDSIPDYSNLIYWAAHPEKEDLSDSVPKPLQRRYHPDTTADVFFIHPTTYTDRSQPFGWNAPIDNFEINTKTDNTTILYQASIFNEAGKVYAPRYRQANIAAYFTLDSPAALRAFDTAYADVKAAFQYYLAHYNNGRPIVIASHSQGTTHAKRLLKEFFDGKPLQQQLIAAYLVGMFVEPDYLSSLPVCTQPNATGCMCSWRTFRENYEPEYIAREKFTSIVTNPLTWDTSKTVAKNDLHKGGVLLNFNNIVPHLCNAQVHKGILWINRPRFFGGFLYKSKNYHIADYNLFYMNVRENVTQRVEAFKKSKSAL